MAVLISIKIRNGELEISCNPCFKQFAPKLPDVKNLAKLTVRLAEIAQHLAHCAALVRFPETGLVL
jgi:hypothetical protein